MDFAANYHCLQGCYKQSFPGLWTIPIHIYQDLQRRNCTTIGSNHCRVPPTKEKFFQYLKYNLNRHLHSNHAPFIMAFDTYWLNKARTVWRIEGLKLFIERTLRHHSDDVYFVRLIDIINWMKRPVGLKQMKQGYLSNISIEVHCNETSRIDHQCANGKEMQISQSSMIKDSRSLFTSFGGILEPLFRSNIVLYSTTSFFILITFTLVYDRSLFF